MAETAGFRGERGKIIACGSRKGHGSVTRLASRERDARNGTLPRVWVDSHPGAVVLTGARPAAVVLTGARPGAVDLTGAIGG